MAKILMIDDENQFRESLASRLQMRGYETVQLPSGENAVKTVRLDSEIDVVLLDRKMPGMSGEEVIREIKRYRPELQVIMLTGHGSANSAMEAGKLDAYAYLEKPPELEKIIETIEDARKHKHRAMEKHDVVHVEEGGLWKWLKGTHNSRPGLIILGLILFATVVLMPTPDRLTELLSHKKLDNMEDINMGYADYRKLGDGENIAYYYSKKYDMGKTVKNADGTKEFVPMTVEENAFRAKVMIGILIIAALFWASGAVPIGITALLVGVLMYFLGVLKPNAIASSYVKDSVIFVFGVLAFSTAITKTGLDRRIGLLLLGSSKSIPMFLFVFLPIFAVTCSFLSEHALIAFIMPVLLVVYLSSLKASGIQEDTKLAVMLFLAVNFAANNGGPGSPAAGGRNAIMLGILQDYGISLSFGEWVQYGLPFVPVMALVVGFYFYIACYRKSQVKKLNVGLIVKQASEKIGPMTKQEYITAAVLVVLIFLWITMSDVLGMGGPVIFAIVALNFFRILSWKNIAKIQWEVVALYAAATAMGAGLAITGGALYIADTFVSMLPEFLRSGEGLVAAAGLFTAIATNFMSDGAAVSAIGPITVPMATIANATVGATSPLFVGLATAFASSFAHMFVIGTPNNAIVFTMAKNPLTGKQLVSLGDFFKHGLIVWILSMAVLIGWVVLGYWQWM